MVCMRLLLPTSYTHVAALDARAMHMCKCLLTRVLPTSYTHVAALEDDVVVREHHERVVRVVAALQVLEWKDELAS